MPLVASVETKVSLGEQSTEWIQAWIEMAGLHKLPLPPQFLENPAIQDTISALFG